MDNRDALYGRRWRNARAAHLRANPLCLMCERQGRIKPANVVDHIEPHRGDPAIFWDKTKWQSLCSTHNNSEKQSIEKGGKPRLEFDAQGYPIWPGGGTDQVLARSSGHRRGR